MSTEQRIALEAIPDEDLMVGRAELAAALHDPPETGLMSNAQLTAYLLATVLATVLAAIVWSATH
jgi:hypothetical protein